MDFAQGIHARLPEPQRISEQRWAPGTIPLVSVLCITFNQEWYVRECLEGILMQETTFPVEVVVHDDASTDGTPAIVLEFAERHPSLFKLILQKVNQYSQGSPPVSIAFRESVGAFIAICEGDDYWNNPTKLEKQVQVLLNNGDCLVCGGRAYVIREPSNLPYTIVPSIPPERLNEIGPWEILRGEWWLKTCTRLTRRGIWADYVDIVGNDEATCDYIFMLYCVSRSGMHPSSFHCVDEVVAVYREHAGGIFTRKSKDERLRANLRILKIVLNRFDFPAGRDSLESGVVAICNELGLTSTGDPGVDAVLTAARRGQRYRLLRRTVERFRALYWKASKRFSL